MSDENVGGLVELLRCPCCNSAAQLSDEYEDCDGNPAVECSQCNLLSWAVSDWNTRVSAHGQPVVDVETLVERACRAVCIENKWDPDMPVMYAGTLRSVKHPDGSPVLQWEMHAKTCRIALSVAFEGAAP